jgi:hypothetical protein
VPETKTDNVEARRRKLWVLAKEIGLCDDERIEWTQYLLRRDITSWVGLDDAQVCRLLDGLESYQLISYLLATRPASPALARDTAPSR